MESFYTRDHEWITIDGKTGTIGITSYAAHELGDITYVDLPPAGKKLKAGDVLCTIESVKAASDIFSPMSGIVAESNQKLTDNPGLVNENPESEGWICRIELSDAAESKSLFNLIQYKEFIKGL